MENGLVYRILLLATAALAVAADPSVKIEVDNPLVEPGADFALRCVAADLVGGTSFLRIRKTITKPDGSLNILDLATNTLLSKSSEQIGRYSVTFEAGTDSKVLTFVFSIKDSQHEDSGKYSCAIMGRNGVIVEDSKDITVINAANLVITMTVTRVNYPDEEPKVFTSLSDEEQVYELDEHEPFHIHVQTSETNPAADLTMMVGNVNINDQFHTTANQDIFEAESGLLVAVKYTVVAEGTIEVDHSYRSGFRVTAKVANEEQSVGFKVKFSGYPPVIDSQCTHSIMAGRYQPDVNFECTITSDEPVEAYFYYFRPLEDGSEREKEIIMPNDQDPSADYHYQIFLYEDRDNGLYNITLHMPRVFPQMFTEYTLYASNSKGNTEHSFTLEEDPSLSIVSPSEASHSYVTTLVLLVIVMATVVLQQP